MEYHHTCKNNANPSTLTPYYHPSIITFVHPYARGPQPDLIDTVQNNHPSNSAALSLRFANFAQIRKQPLQDRRRVHGYVRKSLCLHDTCLWLVVTILIVWLICEIFRCISRHGRISRSWNFERSHIWHSRRVLKLFRALHCLRLHSLLGRLNYAWWWWTCIFGVERLSNLTSLLRMSHLTLYRVVCLRVSSRQRSMHRPCFLLRLRRVLRCVVCARTLRRWSVVSSRRALQ